MEPVLPLILLALGAMFMVMLGLGFVGLYLLVRDTARRRGRWGLNVQAVACPRCQTSLPRVRRPRSLRQALWGGFTCAGCGCELDKWGRQADGGG